VKPIIVRNIIVLLLVIFAISSILGNIKLSPPATSLDNYVSFVEIFNNFNSYSEREQTIKYIFTLIPKNSSVSASYLFVPHLSHREIIYMFPNPFRECYWGAYLGNFTPPPPTKDTEYILVDDTITQLDKEQIINFFLENKIYTKVFEKDDLILLKRDPSVEVPELNLKPL
jgi:uncharacterized membrane protein